jgi:hypothetical protein
MSTRRLCKVIADFFSGSPQSLLQSVNRYAERKRFVIIAVLMPIAIQT